MEHICLCKKSDKKKYCAYKTSYMVFHSPNYMNSMLLIHPIYIIIVTYTQFDSNIRVLYFFWAFKKIPENT